MTPAFPPEYEALWRRITAHDFEPAGQALSFTARLAKEQKWSLAEARRAIEEYRRFCFLAAISTMPITPSPVVDEVWHLHLTYSRDYWTRWCPEVLRTDLHHDPTTGGTAEAQKFAALYARTLQAYEAHFGPPDRKLWPGVAERFALRGSRWRQIRRPAIAVLVAAGAAGWPTLAYALGLNPLDWPAEPFLFLYFCLCVGAFCLSLAVRDRLRARCADADPSNLSAVEVGFLTAGPTRAAETIMVGLAHAGALKRGETRGQTMALDPTGIALHPDIEPFRNATSGIKNRGEILGQIVADMEMVRSRLIERSLAMSLKARKTVEGATVAIVGPVVLFGFAKMLVGLSREKPIGFLVVMTIILIVAAIVLCTTGCRRTKAGDAAVEAYKARHSREMRAPVEGEAIMGFALAGAVALAGTPLAAYVAQPGGSGGDSDGGGDGGSGCGGGGCGGCGGGGGD